MGNQLTDLMDEVQKLKAADPSLQPPPRDVLPPSAVNSEETPVQPAPTNDAPPQRDPGPPRFFGVSLETHTVISNFGHFALEDKESKEITTICLRALARSMRLQFADVAKNHGIDPPKRTGLTIMASELPKGEDDGVPSA